MAWPRPTRRGSPELCERVVKAAEQAGFEYLLIPVGSTCWEAWIAGAFMAACSATTKPLIAARPGYINLLLMAKMISTRPILGANNRGRLAA
jgi:alkanesulfonate monooxygenase